MKDIRVTVNLALFSVIVAVWLALLILIALPGYKMPSELNSLFSTLTGGILLTIQGFEKNITFQDTGKNESVPD